MKKIIILMQQEKRDRVVADFMKHNLEEVLENTVQIQILYIENLENTRLPEADIILVTIYNLIYKIRDNFQGEWEEILLAGRTLSREALQKINRIPEGEDVLVVNKSQETTRDMLHLFYQLGVMHLNFIPFDSPGDLKGVGYIITTSMPGSLPDTAAEIIDIGYRKLDTQTFLNIFSRLNIESDRLTRNLLRYIQKLPQKDTDVEKRYLSSQLLNKTLVKVIEKADSGIIVVDRELNILYCSQTANAILSSDFQPNDSFELPSHPEITKLLTEEGFQQDLVHIEDEYVIVKRQQLMSEDEPIGFFFELRTAKSISEMGNNLSANLKKSGLYARYRFEDIIYRSPAMDKCLATAGAIAKTEYAVLITGETGAGKELLAQSIHNASERASEPFVAINCAAFPENLLESELFGYEGGAFTGSKKGGKTGLFELANKGTIFLDEIGDMPLSLQAKLLRVLQEQQIMRIGSNTVININVRILSATNKDLREEISEKRFRDDLYYRLSVFTICIPPLRERREDILPMFKVFSNKHALRLNDVQIRMLTEYPWPGNVRELKNAAIYYDVTGNLDCIRPAEEAVPAGTALPGTAAAGRTPAGMISAGVTPAGMTSAGMTSSGMTSSGMVSAGMTSSGMVSAGMAPSGTKQAVLYTSAELKNAIVKVLQEFGDIGLGRGRILRIVRQRGMVLSESRFEALAREMAEEGIIRRSRGRGGIRLVENEGIKRMDDEKTE